MDFSPAGIVQIAVPFIWTGLVLGLSFIETPLKFRAPGITRALGLGIGRLVFLALNIAEGLLAVILTVCLLSTGAVISGTNAPVLLTLLVVLWLLLVFQAVILRPQMDARVRRIAAGEQLSRSTHHYYYVGAELIKLIVLPVLGVMLILELG